MNLQEYRSLQEAYLDVYDSDLREQQEFESWITELLDEGYDLSDYNWDEMYEIYNEGIGSAIRGLFGKSKPKPSRGEELRSKYGSPDSRPSRYKKTLKSSGEESAKKVLDAGGSIRNIRPRDTGSNNPGTVTSGEYSGRGNRANRRMGNPPEDTRDQESLVRMGIGSKVKMGHINSRGVKKPIARINASYEPNLFDVILEYLITEGYADTEKAAERIMVNMSEGWMRSIVG